MPPSIDERLDALAREDKWYLADGEGIQWAPPFPVWLHRPGFWDEALVYYHPFAPLYSVALLDRDGHERPLELRSRRWRPDFTDCLWQSAEGLLVRERRYALPGGRFGSSWRVEGGSWSALAGAHLVAFTAQPGEATRDLHAASPGALRWRRTLVDRRGARLDVTATLAAAGGARPVRRAAVRSEGAVAHPIWAHAPFAERWGAEGLREEVRLEGISDTGFVHAALDAAVDGAEAVTFSIEIVADLRAAAPREPGRDDPTAAWRAFFESFPSFSCSDAHLTRYYDYRIYGLGLNRLAPAGNVRHSAIAEGIGYFHVPITYSAQCHIWEARWRNDPALAHGSLLNFAQLQKPDGSFHGRIYTADLERTDFYHANWGDAVLAVEALHPSTGFRARAYETLSRYARWLDATRDPEGCALYDVVDQFETGQEYMSRYQAVDPEADRHGWENRIRLKGIDVAVYAYQLKRALAVLASRVGRAAEVDAWAREAERTGSAITGRMWDEATGIFSDVAPATLARTDVKAAVCFYPLLTDLLSEGHVAHLIAHLRDPREFAAPYPVPSSSLDDPLFNAEAEWKGKRHVCPWNGRVWPMTNSHVVEGLIRQWHRGCRAAGELGGELLARFVRMMFHDGDLARPNCYEHYNPFTGHASVYRGIDDYMHSWVLDLLIRGVAGLEPTLDGLRIHPLPMDVGEADLDGARVAGHEVRVRRRGEEVEARVDGRRHATRLGVPLEIAW